MAHPLGLPMPRFGSHLEYEASIIQWHDDFYIHPLDGVKYDVGYYYHMLSHLTLGQVTFRPYHLYPI